MNPFEERKKEQEAIKQAMSSIKHIIAVGSGKGGVGKSTVAVNLAVCLAKEGYRVGLADADVYGPSLPTLFNIDRTEILATKQGDRELMVPVERYGIKLMSIGFMVDYSAPLMWRGPMASNALKQLLSETHWGELDYLSLDMPPGTGDVPLTCFQSLPVDGIIVVSSPQQLVRVIVEKAVNMANMMNIPILGIVENMSYVKCPDCGKEITVFGKSNIDQIAKSFNIPVLARIPMQEETSRAVDAGDIESLDIPELKEAAETVEKLLKK